ncbi:MAG: hypothetical protein ABI342_04505 [Nitrososphaera sp.]|jgi:hypothetical protein
MNTMRLFLVPALGAFILLVPIIGVFLYAVILYGWYNRNQKNIHAYFLGHDQSTENIDYNGEQFGYLKNGESVEDLK